MASKSFTLRIRGADKDIFDALKKGKKKVETRAATSKDRAIKAGDIFVFVCGNRKLKKRVCAASVFKTPAILLKKYKVKDINPDLKTEKELKDMWLRFPGYAEKIKKHGLIAVKLE